MRRDVFVLVSAVFLSACEPATEPVAQAGKQISDQNPLSTASILVEQPMPEKRPYEMTLLGHTRVDEYFWLRDDTRKDPQVLAFLEEENNYFDKIMEPFAGLQQSMYEEMTARLDPDESSVPYLKNGYWYYSRFVPGHEYAIHARRKGSMEAPEDVMVDGNKHGEGHEFYRLSGLEVSDDHRYVAIAEDTTGRRINEIRILDTQSGEFLPELITNASGSMAWSAEQGY